MGSERVSIGLACSLVTVPRDYGALPFSDGYGAAFLEGKRANLSPLGFLAVLCIL